jgi:hypothetical protein
VMGDTSVVGVRRHRQSEVLNVWWSVRVNVQMTKRGTTPCNQRIETWYRQHRSDTCMWRCDVCFQCLLTTPQRYMRCFTNLGRLFLHWAAKNKLSSSMYGITPFQSTYALVIIEYSNNLPILPSTRNIKS